MDNFTGPAAAFSIANVVETGLEYDRKPGDWYGPSTMIQIFEELNKNYQPFGGLNIVAFPEGIIYQDKMNTKWNSMIIFVGFRLGLDKINTEYFPGILRLMRLKSFVGMSGGQGNGALYFVGYQNKDLIFLDPHVTQASVPKIEELWTEHLSYHYPSIMKLALNKLNTSLAFGTTVLILLPM